MEGVFFLLVWFSEVLHTVAKSHGMDVTGSLFYRRAIGSTERGMWSAVVRVGLAGIYLRARAPSAAAAVRALVRQCGAHHGSTDCVTDGDRAEQQAFDDAVALADYDAAWMGSRESWLRVSVVPPQDYDFPGSYTVAVGGENTGELRSAPCATLAAAVALVARAMRVRVVNGAVEPLAPAPADAPSDLLAGLHGSLHNVARWVTACDGSLPELRPVLVALAYALAPFPVGDVTSQWSGTACDRAGDLAEALEHWCDAAARTGAGGSKGAELLREAGVVLVSLRRATRAVRDERVAAARREVKA